MSSHWRRIVSKSSLFYGNHDIMLNYHKNGMHVLQSMSFASKKKKLPKKWKPTTTMFVPSKEDPGKYVLSKHHNLKFEYDPTEQRVETDDPNQPSLIQEIEAATKEDVDEEPADDQKFLESYKWIITAMIGMVSIVMGGFMLGFTRIKVSDLDDKDENDELDMINDAASKLNMDFFKWHPDHIQNEKNPTSKISEIIEHTVDIIIVLIVFILIHIITGYRPNFGNNIIDWFTIIISLLISCIILSPPLGILLIIVSLPTINEDSLDFNYIGFFSKWGCVSMGLFVLYKTIIGGSIPGSRFF